MSKAVEVRYCNHCKAEREGEWQSIYDWKCGTCGKLDID